MAHEAQIKFCTAVKMLVKGKFLSCRKVLDVGSLDINGSNRYLFPKQAKYIGLDIGKGKNVDVVMPVHVYQQQTEERFDIVISTEMLEHDLHWRKSLQAMYELTKDNGVLIITCATTGRKEHGTGSRLPKDSPYTNAYYRNISIEEFKSVLGSELFGVYFLKKRDTDLQFYGIKKGGN